MSYQDPNFTIITSGGCNSFCDFCTDPYKRKASPDYIKNFEDALFNRLPKNFDQISISGGEPTISPHLTQILGLIKLSNRFRKVVLTTNGTKLKEKIDIIAQGIDHLNVSRHAIGYAKNTAIFGTAEIIKDAELQEAAFYLNKFGIDMNLNCVYSDKDNHDVKFVLDYIDYARSVGATSVSFRYDQNQNSLGQTYLEKQFQEWNAVNSGSCPVCRNHTILVKGMPIVFKAAYAEPSKAIGDVYELIYGIDGRLTSDWEGKNEFTKVDKVNYEKTYDPSKEHVAANVGPTLARIKPRAKPFSLDEVSEVDNTLPTPQAYTTTPRPAKTRKLETFGGGCGMAFGGGCGKS